MAFSIKPEYLIDSVAEPIKAYLTTQYGRTGLKVEEEIRANLQWRPSIQVKTSRFSVLGIEVSEQLYPTILKLAAHDIINSGFDDMPVKIAVACPLAVYLADTRQTITNELRKNGVGLFTVDDQGNVVEQFASIAVIHHINESHFESKILGLPQIIKVKQRSAYKVYRTNCYQGVQEAGQLVEAITMGFAIDCHKQGLVAAFNKRDTVATVIDNLYGSTNQLLVNQRAAIGGARSFIRYFRNLSSHPAKNTKEAVKQITECRDGFMTALNVINNLITAVLQCNSKIQLFIP